MRGNQKILAGLLSALLIFSHSSQIYAEDSTTSESTEEEVMLEIEEASQDLQIDNYEKEVEEVVEEEIPEEQESQLQEQPVFEQDVEEEISVEESEQIDEEIEIVENDYTVSTLEMEEDMVLLGIPSNESDDTEDDTEAEEEQISAIFIDGRNGNDTNLGTYELPVKTFARAKELLNSTGVDTIYVIDTIRVTGEETWSLNDGQSLKRYDTYHGDLVYVTGTLTLNNIVIDGASEVTGANNKRLIEVSYGTLNVNEGAVIQNNSNEKYQHNQIGGCVYLSRSQMNMNGGTFQNCTAAWAGGAVAATNQSNVVMNSGTFVSNRANQSLTSASIWYAAGGAVLISGESNFTMNGGTFTNNYSNHAGGAIAVGTFNSGVIGGTFTMNGGSIDHNSATDCGGALFIQMNGEAIFNAGNITYNTVTTNRAYFGGGAVYVNGGKSSTYTNGVLYLNNVEISDNHTGERGGAIAACVTADIRVYVEIGSLIYNNTNDWTGETEIYLSQIGDYTLPENYISEFMLGGGNYEWRDTNTGELVSVDLLHKERKLLQVYNDKTADDPEVIEGKKYVTTLFAHNSSGSSGGAIGSNGDVFIGKTEYEDGEIIIQKTWDDAEHEDARPQSISVRLKYGNYELGTHQLNAENDYKVTIPRVLSEVINQENAQLTIEELDISDDYVLKSAHAIVNGKTVTISLENTYLETEVTLFAEKYLNEKTPDTNTFSFVLKDEDGNEIETVNNDGKNIAFSTVKFDEVGSYQYTIEEVVGNDTNITYSTDVYTITIDVRKENDELVSYITMQKNNEEYTGIPTFYNTSKPTVPDTPGEEPKKPPVPDTSDIFDMQNFALFICSMMILCSALYISYHYKEDNE